MNRRQVSFLVASATMLGGFAGCAGTPNNRAAYLNAQRPAMAPGCDRCAGNGPMPPRYSPNPAPVFPGPAPVGGIAPPPGIMAAPPGPIGPPPGPASPPAGAEIQQNGYVAPTPTNPSAPAASGAGVYLEQPEPVTPDPLRETRPYTPQTAEPPAAPPARDDRAASPAMPVDIPQFAMVKTNLASGQEPFAEGVAWLKSHGYRTVLHVRAAGEDDSAARKQYEQAGLRYLTLELSPQTLTKEIVDRFNRLVGDAENLPLFVYDKDSSLAGALWYLHFRLAEKETDEQARQNAENLGFRQDRSDAYLKMWLAVQNLLKDLKS